MSDNLPNAQKYFLITGASSGLGYAYCQVALDLGYSVIGVSRHCQSITQTLKKRDAAQTIIALDHDLSNQQQFDALIAQIKGYHIINLINNAGIGYVGSLATSDVNEQLNMLNLNINALVFLTHYFVQYFQTQGINGRIINIGSIGSFAPGPLYATYYASKAFVRDFSNAVNYELHKAKSAVRVVCIIAGQLKTNFLIKANHQQQTVVKFNASAMNVEQFAKCSLSKALKTKKANLVFGWMNKIWLFYAKIVSRKRMMHHCYSYQKQRFKAIE